MIEIENKTIKISRGDSVTFDFIIPISDTENYKFQVGDKIQFRIFEKNGYDKAPILQKEFIATTESEKVNILLEEIDTTIGEPINKKKTYWYEISLNEVQTPIGYDDDGPAEFILYPAKGGEQ